MFIRISSNGSVSLHELEDFQRFKLISELPQSSLCKLRRSLGVIGEIENSRQAWVKVGPFLKFMEPYPDEAWLMKFNDMVNTARPYGYVRDEPLSIGAHIEWQECSD